MKKLVTILLSIIFLFNAKSALAAVRCETQYGGSEVCVRTGQLQIDKEVWNPDTESFVDNLGLSDHKFSPGDEIVFKLKIKNVGDDTFSKVEVRDYLPELIDLTNGDISFDINDLHAGDVNEYVIKTKVVDASEFPNNKTVICEVNTAETWSGDERDKDTAQVCLTTNVLGITTLPKTGPAEIGMIVFGLLFLVLTGLKLTLNK
jgi:uncharacterized repeat protein (TIGR01451 family)